jgi:cytochrome c553
LRKHHITLRIFFLIAFIFLQGNLVRADVENPETTLATALKVGPCPETRHTPRAPRNFLRMGSPLEDTPINLRLGETLYHLDTQPSCKSCHGVRGNGMGDKSKEMSPPPRNFSCSYTMKEISDGQMFWIIKYGSPHTPMPKYEDLYDEQIWQLILYIRHLSK